MSAPDPLDFQTTASPPGDPGRTHTFGGGRPPPGPPGTAAPGPPDGVPGFEIMRELGRGGMGVVYLARQVGLNREVALKMVLGGAHASAGERQRFLAEAEAVAAVQHPGVVQVYGFGTHDGLPYFALEYCPGGSLAQKLAGTPLPARAAAELVERLARAVQAAHDRGIVHRDLKPANVLLDAAGEPKITDFGLARRGDAGSGLTATGAILGTPSYMAPEQARGEAKSVGPGADVYALGAILYECLTGRPPFRAATALETIHQVLRDDPVPPSRLVSGLPRDLETIALKCLAKEPARRYAAAAALADDLRRFRAGETIAARPAGAAEKLWKAARRRPAVAAGAAGVVLAAAAVVGVVAVKNAELRIERDAARHAGEEEARQRRLADAARAEADAQRQKAHDRLEAAVRLIERVAARLDGDAWLASPELAKERQELLNEAVVFFRGFTGEDTADPLVVREQAKAFFRVGALLLQVGEPAKGRAALEDAARLQRQLVERFPGEPDYRHALARTEMYRGHAINLTTDFTKGPATDGLDAYRAGAELAGRAAAARPDRTDYRLTRAECLLAVGQFFSVSDPAAAAQGYAQARELVEPVAARPDAPPEARVLLAQTVLFAGAAELRQGKAAGQPAALDRAATGLAGLSRESFEEVRAKDQFTHARANLQLSRAALLARQPARRDEALALVREAAADVDRQLARYPKQFPIRQLKLNALATEADLLAQLDRPAEARARFGELFRLADDIVRDAPHMTWVKGSVLTQRATDLVLRARAGDTAGLDAVADELRAAARPDQRDRVAYDTACAYAQASRHGSAADRERFAVTAARLLAGLLDGPYFRNPARAARLDKDADLDPLRDRADFRAFAAKARAAAGVTP